MPLVFNAIMYLQSSCRLTKSFRYHFKFYISQYSTSFRFSRLYVHVTYLKFVCPEHGILPSIWPIRVNSTVLVQSPVSITILGPIQELAVDTFPVFSRYARAVPFDSSSTPPLAYKLGLRFLGYSKLRA